MQVQGMSTERVLFGLLLIVGYLMLGIVGVAVGDKNPAAIPLIRDMLLTLGPLLGMIVQAIWRTNSVDATKAATDHLLAQKAPDYTNLPAATLAVVPDGSAVSLSPAPQKE